MGSLEGKVALITGGTGALGRAVSAAFVQAGAKAIVTCIVDEEVAPFRAVLPPDKCELVKLDVQDPTAVAVCVGEIVAKRERIDVLVHLVGGFWGGSRL